MRAVLALTAVAALTAHAQITPAVFPAGNVSTTYFGTVVDDPYRALEDTTNPEVAEWARSQADYARATLDSLPGYKALRARVAEFDEATAAVVGSVRLDGKGNVYFTRRGAAENTFKLYRRDAKAPRSCWSIPTTGRRAPASRTRSTTSGPRPMASSSRSAFRPSARSRRPSTSWKRRAGGSSASRSIGRSTRASAGDRIRARSSISGSRS